jgi:hypothetical protein
LIVLAAAFELRLLLLLLLSLPKKASASMDLRRFVDALSRLIVACGRSLQQCETPITTDSLTSLCSAFNNSMVHGSCGDTVRTHTDL